ncbi:hypothetical protein [Isoptericola sp. NPDC056605]|uniref:hypothetical protein n=1 Tax=Isoptericola sp. NPDC056605 TaxID=3345876 RepID=UPI00368D9AA8
MSTHRLAPAVPAGLIVVGLIVAAVLLPAPAGADEIGAGPTTSPPGCALERVDDQLVRCDELTGAGVPAPGSVPEWSPGSLR